MNRSLKMQLTVGILAAASCQLLTAHHHPEAGGQQTVAVHLYDLAGVSQRDLDTATKEATRLLTTAGIEPVWQVGPSDAQEAHEYDSRTAWPGSPILHRDNRDYLVVAIAPDFPARSLPGALGYSLPDAQFGVQATVFYNRIVQVSRSGGVDLATMLGHALAHEIGHVLLGSTEHSDSGIMKARWGKDDYQRASMGLITFDKRERETIRQNLGLRLSKGNTK